LAQKHEWDTNGTHLPVYNPVYNVVHNVYTVRMSTVIAVFGCIDKCACTGCILYRIAREVVLNDVLPD
jgi:hypothetical protein